MSRHRLSPDVERAREWRRSTTRLTVDTYRQEKLYPTVVRAFNALLLSQDEVGPEAVFVAIGILRKHHLAAWRNRKIPYLEKTIASNLSRINRQLHLMRFHAHDLCMREVLRPTKLRFTKSGHPNAETNWHRHYQIIGPREKFLERKLGVQASSVESPGQADSP